MILITRTSETVETSHNKKYNMTKEIPRHKVVDNYVFLCTFMRANTAQKMAYSADSVGPTLLQSAFIAVWVETGVRVDH